MRESGSIISGSAALWFIHRQAGWFPHDIDLYVAFSLYEFVINQLLVAFPHALVIIGRCFVGSISGSDSSKAWSSFAISTVWSEGNGGEGFFNVMERERLTEEMSLTPPFAEMVVWRLGEEGCGGECCNGFPSCSVGVKIQHYCTPNFIAVVYRNGSMGGTGSLRCTWKDGDRRDFDTVIGGRKYTQTVSVNLVDLNMSNWSVSSYRAPFDTRGSVVTIGNSAGAARFLVMRAGFGGVVVGIYPLMFRTDAMGKV
ncbi:hypothetical protein BKA93DRAFT_753693 [Sparassis latifolia]